MSETSISVWFVCKLCRGSFGQVDAFIEHKKQKHFTQFQKISCIIFEESERGKVCPVITNKDRQLANESNEPPIKIEVDDEDPINPASSEIIDEPSFDLFKVKSELITVECEVYPDDENNFFGLKQPEQNPYVHLKGLTSEEIQNACVPQHQATRSKCEQQKFVSNLETPNLSADVERISSDFIEVEKRVENERSASVKYISTEDAPQFECKLCSKQLESEAQLKIHLGICAQDHEDRSRFCVTCNRKFCDNHALKAHCLRFHGTKEEKLSLYKFKCHVCQKQFQRASHLKSHLETHKGKEEQALSKLKCSHPTCGKLFRDNTDLQRHIKALHSNLRPFSCSFPKCNRTFRRRDHLNTHFMTHT